MGFLLDTDHVSILQQQNQPAYDALCQRLRQHSPSEIVVSIVSFQEQVQGWFTYLNNARTPEKVLLAYARLNGLLRYYAEANLLLFDQTAQTQFEQLQQSRIRVGTLDLRIAAIALANHATLLSRNRRDFRKVPGLFVDDWTSTRSAS